MVLKKMLSLSNSTLSLFLECPRCFWLQFNEKIVRPKGIFPSLPTGMDIIIKEYFNRYREKGELPPLIKDKVEGKLAKIPLNLSIVNDSLDLKITGRLDECLELEDDSFIPLDHKTRGKLPDDLGYSQSYYQTQMDTYTLLLRESGYRTKNLAYIIYYSPGPGELHHGIPFGVEVHRIKTYPENAYKYFKQAKSCLDGTLPSSSADCEFCNWNKEVSQYI